MFNQHGAKDPDWDIVSFCAVPNLFLDGWIDGGGENDLFHFDRSWRRPRSCATRNPKQEKSCTTRNFFYSPSVMDINENVKALILQGLRKKKQTKVWLAEQMGLNKSWATRLLNGQLKTLSDDHAEKIMKILGIEFFTLKRVDDTQISAKGMQVAAEFDRNPAFATVATALQNAMKETVYTPRFIPTEKMAAIGDEIIRICFANEDKPGKVARLVLELLA